MTPPYIDIHTHNCMPEGEVIKVCVYDLAQNGVLPEGRFVAGVHPWSVKTVLPDALDFFEQPHAGLIGVGEIGLDFSHTYADKNQQLAWFSQQLAIAERLELPIVLHCVKAYNEILTELKNYRLKAVIFHGFIGSPELAGRIMIQGYYISFGQPAFRSPKTIASLESIPLSYLFLETDDNPQMDIKELYEETSIARGIPLDELKQQIYTNYKTIFND